MLSVTRKEIICNNVDQACIQNVTFNRVRCQKYHLVQAYDA